VRQQAAAELLGRIVEMYQELSGIPRAMVTALVEDRHRELDRLLDTFVPAGPALVALELAAPSASTKDASAEEREEKVLHACAAWRTTSVPDFGAAGGGVLVPAAMLKMLTDRCAHRVQLVACRRGAHKINWGALHNHYYDASKDAFLQRSSILDRGPHDYESTRCAACQTQLVRPYYGRASPGGLPWLPVAQPMHAARWKQYLECCRGAGSIGGGGHSFAGGDGVDEAVEEGEEAHAKCTRCKYRFLRSCETRRWRAFDDNLRYDELRER
jgi:hypothetical protein